MRYRHNCNPDSPSRESRREYRAKSGAYVKREARTFKRANLKGRR